MSFLYFIRFLVDKIYGKRKTSSVNKRPRKYRRLVDSFSLRKKLSLRDLADVTHVRGKMTERRKSFIILMTLDKATRGGEVRERAPSVHVFESPYLRQKRLSDFEDENPPKRVKVNGIEFSRPLDLHLVTIDLFMEVLGEPVTFEEAAKMDILFDRQWLIPSANSEKEGSPSASKNGSQEPDQDRAVVSSEEKSNQPNQMPIINIGPLKLTADGKLGPEINFWKLNPRESKGIEGEEKRCKYRE